MEFKKFGNKIIIRIDKGEEIVETLKNFCEQQDIKLGTIQGIGATNKVKIGLFDTESKQYFSNEYKGDFEIAPLYGNISTMDGKIYLHLHVNMSRK
jgi:uncharacterized protein